MAFSTYLRKVATWVNYITFLTAYVGCKMLGAMLTLYGLTIGVYVWLQFLTLKFERHYSLIVFLLVCQVVFGVVFVVLAITGIQQLHWLLLLTIAAWTVVVLCILAVKVMVFDFLRIRSPKFIVRQRVRVGLEHEKLTLCTSDNVEIAAIHLRRDHKSVVIVCHGGGHDKSTAESLLIAEWLSYDYDIIAFDARGHFESGGEWTADGATKLDLVAVLQYARNCGYEKVGALGRSLGGWTAILVAAEHVCAIDSMVIVSAPLGHIRDTPMVSQIEFLKSLPGRLFVRAVHGLRYKDYRDTDTPTPLEIGHTLTSPILLIYSTDDDTIGVNEAMLTEFYESISGKKELFIFRDANHLPMPWHLGPIYRMSLQWFAQTMQ